MVKITCTQFGNKDMMKIDGDVDADVIAEIEQTVSLIRSQGSDGLLWNGEGIGHVQSQELNRLTRTFRVYRQMGGRIVLAAFPESALRAIERTTWKRFINVFKNVGEAKEFLGIRPEQEPQKQETSEEISEPEIIEEAQLSVDQDADSDEIVDHEALENDPEGKIAND